MTCLEHDAGTVGLPVIESYPALDGWQLHSLEHQVAFTCGVCAKPRESVLVAVDGDQRPICPACYAQHR